MESDGDGCCAQEAKAAGKPNRPFFVAVGFHRPHLPWFAPKKFYDLYPPAESMPGPTHPEVPVGMPGVAWHGGGPTAMSIDKPAPMNFTLRARRGLYATMSYVDSLVGDVLGELDTLGLTNETVVSFVGESLVQIRRTFVLFAPSSQAAQVITASTSESTISG